VFLAKNKLKELHSVALRILCSSFYPETEKKHTKKYHKSPKKLSLLVHFCVEKNLNLVDLE